MQKYNIKNISLKNNDKSFLFYYRNDDGSLTDELLFKFDFLDFYDYFYKKDDHFIKRKNLETFFNCFIDYLYNFYNLEWTPYNVWSLFLDFYNSYNDLCRKNQKSDIYHYNLVDWDFI